MTSSFSNLVIRSVIMPYDGKRRRKTHRHKRSSTRTPKSYKEQAQSYTKALNSGDYSDRALSDSPDPDVSSTNNNSEATSLDEGTEETSSQEDTPISEASRATIHIEMLTSQLNFWEQERRKRSAKRHNRGTRSRRGCYKHRRKSRRFSPTPKPKRIPRKVLPEEPATNSQEKITTTDEQPCSTDETFKATTPQQKHPLVTPPLISDSLQSHGAKPPAAVPWSTGNQRRAQACKRGGTDWLESAKKIHTKPHQDRHPTPYTPDEPPSRPSEHFHRIPGEPNCQSHRRTSGCSAMEHPTPTATDIRPTPTY